MKQFIRPIISKLGMLLPSSELIMAQQRERHRLVAAGSRDAVQLHAWTCNNVSLLTRWLIGGRATVAAAAIFERGRWDRWLMFMSAEDDVLVSEDLYEPYGDGRTWLRTTQWQKSTFASGKMAEDARICGRPGSFEVVWDCSQDVKSLP